MEATLTQPCRVNEEGAMRRKVLLEGAKTLDLSSTDGTFGISTG
jgi:hypothetical protein